MPNFICHQMLSRLVNSPGQVWPVLSIAVGKHKRDSIRIDLANDIGIEIEELGHPIDWDVTRHRSIYKFELFII